MLRSWLHVYSTVYPQAPATIDYIDYNTDIEASSKYCTVGKFGGVFNLVIWRSGEKLSN